MFGVGGVAGRVRSFMQHGLGNQSPRINVPYANRLVVACGYKMVLGGMRRQPPRLPVVSINQYSLGTLIEKGIAVDLNELIGGSPNNQQVRVYLGVQSQVCCPDIQPRLNNMPKPALLSPVGTQGPLPDTHFPIPPRRNEPSCYASNYRHHPLVYGGQRTHQVVLLPYVHMACLGSGRDGIPVLCAAHRRDTLQLPLLTKHTFPAD
mmetsp:Transcript_24922/g.41057  ORF Transcript_24922/g.41057 Transcript_24922/m.41057 type:complete len:206 (+) Transcript_24922:750-1367(+)